MNTHLSFRFLYDPNRAHFHYPEDVALRNFAYLFGAKMKLNETNAKRWFYFQFGNGLRNYFIETLDHCMDETTGDLLTSYLRKKCSKMRVSQRPANYFKRTCHWNWKEMLNELPSAMIISAFVQGCQLSSWNLDPKLDREEFD